MLLWIKEDRGPVMGDRKVAAVTPTPQLETGRLSPLSYPRSADTPRVSCLHVLFYSAEIVEDLFLRYIHVRVFVFLLVVQLRVNESWKFSNSNMMARCTLY